MTDWKVAVPSSGRADRIGDLTVGALAAGGVPPDRVAVFVPAREEDAYAPLRRRGVDVVAVDYTPARGPVEGGPYAVGRVRNAINRHYPPGTRLVQCDDDLKGWVTRHPTAEKLVPVANVAALFTRGFDLCDVCRTHLWGIYPVANARWLKVRNVDVGLRFLIGQTFGTILRDPTFDAVLLDEKDDYERSLRYYEADGAVIRLGDVAASSKVYRGAGGMQQVRNPETAWASVAWLIGRWPSLVQVNRRRSGDWPEVLLRRGPLRAG